MFSTLAPKYAYPHLNLLKYMNAIGEKIKKIREEKGITQESMALHLNVTQSNYGRLEKDDRRLNVVKLLKIVKILDINMGHLFSEASFKGQSTSYENLNQSGKEVYELLVDSLRGEISHLKDEVNFLRGLVKN